MSGIFDGKVALVTGGNSGIGKATAIKFAREGAKVVIAARRVPEGEQVVEEISNDGGDALFIRTDVSQATEVEAMVSKTVETYGKLDCAFNNAATSGGGLVHELTEESWDHTMAVNLKGIWLCMKYEIIQMLQQGGGTIVNNSSIQGLVGLSLSPLTSATKHGIVGLTKSAALQYSKNAIRINAVCPGIVRTPSIEDLHLRVPGLEERALEISPLGRLGTSDEIAEAVVWLSSDAASFVTGSAMVIDGALIAGMKPV